MNAGTLFRVAVGLSLHRLAERVSRSRERRKENQTIARERRVKQGAAETAAVYTAQEYTLSQQSAVDWWLLSKKENCE